jgi:hypothetical protein
MTLASEREGWGNGIEIPFFPATRREGSMPEIARAFIEGGTWMWIVTVMAWAGVGLVVASFAVRRSTDLTRICGGFFAALVFVGFLCAFVELRFALGILPEVAPDMRIQVLFRGLEIALYPAFYATIAAAVLWIPLGIASITVRAAQREGGK